MKERHAPVAHLAQTGGGHPLTPQLRAVFSSNAYYTVKVKKEAKYGRA